MNDKLNSIIAKLYNSLMEKPFEVLEIFNDFFGEERVDMQNYLSLEEFREIMLGLNLTQLYIPEDIQADVKVSDIKNSSISDVESSIVVPLLDRNFSSLGNTYFSDIRILVWFPHVRITNEYDKYVDINNLWAKVSLDYKGVIGGTFGLNRSEYSTLHIEKNYLHSHISNIPTDDFELFQIPCLGEGPIRDTISNLSLRYDKFIWKLFCLELDKYVATESVSGIPYHYLESLESYTSQEINLDDELFINFQIYSVLNSSEETLIREFIKYFINSKKLKFNYFNGSYSLGMSMLEYVILISNEFISWYNNLSDKYGNTVQQLFRDNIIGRYAVDNDKIYKTYHIGSNPYYEYEGETVCVFKGKPVTIHITDESEGDYRNISIFLNFKIAIGLLIRILNVLNFRYGRYSNSRNQSDSKIKYLL